MRFASSAEYQLTSHLASEEAFRPVQLKFFKSMHTLCILELSPHHLVDDTDIALYDLHYLGTDVLVHIVGNGDAVLTVTAELDGGINGLEQ